MGEFRMPSLGADMDVGTVVEWLVRPGDAIRRGQVVAVVDTAKAAMEIEAFESGVLEAILVEVGTQVPVGTPLAIIATAVPAVPAEATPTAHDAIGRATPPVRHLAHQLGVDLSAVPGSGPDGHVSHADVLAAAAASGTAPGGPSPGGPARGRGPEAAAVPVPEGRLRVSPRARRLAAERGVDLAGVAGSGAGAAVLAADVERATAMPAAPPAAALDAALAVSAAQPARPTPRAADPQRRAAMRTAIATLMARSNAEIPHYYVQQTLDLGPALGWLRTANADLPAARRLLPAVLFLRATVLAAQAVPELNGHWVEGALRTTDRVDLGVAVATRGGGLITPAIPDAGLLGVHDLMARLADLVARARRGTLKQAEMAGASITVSSLGEDGPDALAGVIFPPQVALVCVGGIVERPWAVSGMLTVRPTATITLAADHRASDGRTASAFLAAFAHALAHPEEL